MEPIQMVDLKGQFQKIKKEVLEGIEELCNEATFINGPQVKSFAKNLREYTGAGYVVPCANGTDAIQIAFMALGLKPGDEVIVPSWTYVATAEVIALLGLKPVFIDAEYHSFNLNVEHLEKVLTPLTKAIVPVHLYGQCCDMESIMKFAEANNLYVIEDTAQAIGAEYTFADQSVRQAGTIGHVGTTSFFPSKNLGGYGDGGACFANDETIAKKLQAICDHGQLHQKYFHELVGVNSRLDSMQAVILNAKLAHLKTYERARNEVAESYTQAFKGLKGIETPVTMPYSTHVFHQYTLKITNGARDEFKKYMESRNIPTMIYYPMPLHYQKAYAPYLRGNESLEVSERLASEVISLPIHTEMSTEHKNYIIENVKSFFNG